MNMTNKDLELKIENLTRIIERVAVPIPAIPAIQAIPAIPAIPPLPQYTGDHDLIVEINTEVKGLKEAFKKLAEKEDTHATKIEFFERMAVTDKIFNDHETRIRSNEVSITRILTWGTSMMFVLGLSEFLLLKVWK